jgi:hypothetical protein
MRRGHDGPRKVVMPDGTQVELRQDVLSTELVITKSGGKPAVIWRSGLENCHGLSVSPEGHLVAYVCETNGVIRHGTLRGLGAL